eukprot:1777354-Amphidinium_carterae.1
MNESLNRAASAFAMFPLRSTTSATEPRFKTCTGNHEKIQACCNCDGTKGWLLVPGGPRLFQPQVMGPKTAPSAVYLGREAMI